MKNKPYTHYSIVDEIGRRIGCLVPTKGPRPKGLSGGSHGGRGKGIGFANGLVSQWSHPLWLNGKLVDAHEPREDAQDLK